MTDARQPTGQDLVCLVCRKEAQDIDHVVNRGMGGSKERDVPENKVPLCRECHELKTLGRIVTRVKTGTFEDGAAWFVYEWRKADSDVLINAPVEVSDRYKCLVLSDGAEAAKSGSIIKSGRGDEGKADLTLPRGLEGDIAPESVAAHTSAPSPSAGEKEEGDETTLDGLRDVAGPGDVDVGSNPKSLPVLTHEQRVAIAQEIKDAEWNRQWIAGDTGNAWIAELGESAEQYLSDFGYVHESLANILRVCAAIPPPYRNGNLRYSHHTVVYDQPPEDRMRWLTECAEEQWSVAEFRRQVKGTKTKAKRWTLEELREKLATFEHEPPRSDEAAMVSAESIVFFLDWIESHAA
ncbi:hypothetical protein LCGC14_0382500 [marine sediment metagenome]|uniref:HNH nuclease domain-containing protein n=1 Tax=marine sediment metagenome TaxID=412755 RepID=A0A0F9VP39_9ZZZZ